MLTLGDRTEGRACRELHFDAGEGGGESAQVGVDEEGAVMQDSSSRQPPRRARKLGALPGAVGRDEEPAPRPRLGLDSQLSQGADDEGELRLLVMSRPGDEDAPIQVAAILIDGAASRYPSQHRELGAGGNLNPGILISTDDDAGIVHIDEDGALESEAALEKTFLQGKITKRIASGATQRCIVHI